MKNKKKTIGIIMAVVLLIAASVLGTLAWLTDKTDSITNTFTVGNIDIDLTESDDLNLKMVPGVEIEKDPLVTVKANSEASWLFVKIEKSTNFDTFLEYQIAAGWEELTLGSGVFWRKVDAVTADVNFAVLNGNKVTVKNGITKDMMDAIADPDNSAKEPTLTFTAYAIQQSGFTTADAAWTELTTTTP